MCGIAGLVGGFVPELAERMNRLQKHRGPDGEGIFESAAEEITLAHVRLAILDRTPAAAQPMHSACGRYVLVFNGEIYNYRELRSGLVARGHKFASTGDTEVLLDGLTDFGEAFLSRLNGIFALAFWDRHERTLLLARDQIGIKPLYYAEPATGQLVFASEIKALCAHPRVRREADFAAIQQHLAYCHASADRTAFKHVRRLLPGHKMIWSAADRQTRIASFWSAPFGRPQTASRARAVEVLRERLREAISRQLVSDVPVGVFLSGGLDSSMVSALAAEDYGVEMNAFTMRFPKADGVLDTGGEDLAYARRLSRELDMPLHEELLGVGAVEDLPKLVYHMDEPLVDPAMLSCYAISRSAREKGVVVLLSGQGGDELFCGYPRYMVMHLSRWIERVPMSLRHTAARWAGMLPSAHEGRSGVILRRLRKALVGIDEPLDERFLDMCANTPQEDIDAVWTPAARAEIDGIRFQDDCLRYMERSGLQGLQRLQDRDLGIYLPNHNLLYTDKMGMAAGVEIRVPLLDLEIVNESVRYPYEWQLSGLRTKALFRDAARGIVPSAIIRRRKAGFGAPFRKWLRYDLAEMWGDICSPESLRRRGWFDHTAVQAARELSQSGRQDLYMLQWAVLTIELWARQFIDRNPAQKNI